MRRDPRIEAEEIKRNRVKTDQEMRKERFSGYSPRKAESERAVRTAGQQAERSTRQRRRSSGQSAELYPVQRRQNGSRSRNDGYRSRNDGYRSRSEESLTRYEMTRNDGQQMREPSRRTQNSTVRKRDFSRSVQSAESRMQSPEQRRTGSESRTRSSASAQASRPQGSRNAKRRPSEMNSYRSDKAYYEESLREKRYTYSDEPEDPRDLKRASKKEQKKEKPKKKSKVKRVLIGILCFLLIIVIAAGVVWFVPSYRTAAFKYVLRSPFGPKIGKMMIGENYEKYVQDKDFDESKIIINNGVKTPEGYRTIALLGVDARTEDLDIGTMSDSMVVVNIDQEGHIKMASVFRDTILLSRMSNGDPVISKANSSYFRNGPIGTLNMLNENFDLALTDYIVVNFWGLANIVDILGGIKLKITKAERKALNFYMKEQARYGNKEYIPLKKSGKSVLLTGDQATAFCRLRKTTFKSPLDGQTYTDDFGRTARQRYVLNELLVQTKGKGMLKLMKVANELFEANGGERKFLQTSLTIEELIQLFAMGYDMEITDTAGYPDLNYAYEAIMDIGSSIVADRLEDSVSLMHDFLYETNGYEPTEDMRNIETQIREEVARQTGGY